MKGLLMFISERNCTESRQQEDVGRKELAKNKKIKIELFRYLSILFIWVILNCEFSSVYL